MVSSTNNCSGDVMLWVGLFTIGCIIANIFSLLTLCSQKKEKEKLNNKNNNKKAQKITNKHPIGVHDTAYSATPPNDSNNEHRRLNPKAYDTGEPEPKRPPLGEQVDRLVDNIQNIKDNVKKQEKTPAYPTQSSKKLYMKSSKKSRSVSRVPPGH